MAVSISAALITLGAIIDKYGHYDQDEEALKEAFDPDDPFSSQLAMIRSKLGELYAQSQKLSEEQNRALAATGFAELRRAKNKLVNDDIPELQSVIKRGKNVTPDVITGRLQQLQAVLAEVDSINDGVNISRPLRPEMAEVSTGMFGWGKKVGGNLGEIQLTMRDGDPELNPNNYQETDESRAFQEEWMQAKATQDDYLSRIGRGVGDLKEMALAQQDELNRQNPILETVETRVDKLTSELRSNNAKLKEVLFHVRTTRKFCIDFILIIVALGIGMYIFQMIKK